MDKRFTEVFDVMDNIRYLVVFQKNGLSVTSRNTN